MTQITQMKCACTNCLCIVEIDSAVVVNDRYYCSTACGEGNCKNGGCGHKGCGC